MAEVAMPRLSDTMEQGTVAKWLKLEGEPVAKGEPLVEIETDKANMVLDSYESGILESIVVHEGQTVPIGQPIAYIATERAVGKPAAPAAGAAPAAPPKAVPTPPTPAQPPVSPPPEEVEAPERIKASPIARRIAEEHGVDLSQVTGTGPGGRITKEDVESFLRQRTERPAAAPAPAVQPRPAPTAPPAPAVPPGPAVPATESETVPMTRMQSTIARRMTESKTTAPHFYVTNSVTIDAALDLRRALNAALGEQGQIGINDLVVKAAALALRKFPDVNASYHDGQLEYHKRINIGIAVAVPHGLIVPVLRDADRKSLAEIAREGQDLIERTRSNRLAPAEWEGGTFTVSNLGMFDVDEFVAIITPPQSGILAVGSIQPRPMVVDEQIKIARRVKLTVSADHRVFYGAMAAEFLQEIKRLLENPLSLLL